jgi:pyruvate dehydrogenase E2 component (dihydrolipoamide acetyltransferase)
MAEVDFRLPKFGMTMQEGTIEEWLVEIGDEIEVGQEIVVVSTDKVDNAVSSPASGTVSQILVETGETVDPGTLLAVITVS